MKKTIVLKTSGKLLSNKKQLVSFIQAVKVLMVKHFVILVHGGGEQLDQWQKKLNLKIKKIDGKRITDEKTLDLAIMLFKGLINTHFVAQFLKQGIKTVGLSGVDGQLVLASKRPTTPIDFGFVGNIKKINLKILKILLNGGFLPIIACLGIDKKGQVLNINADTIAACLAMALKAEKLVFISDVKGIKVNNKYLKSLSL